MKLNVYVENGNYGLDMYNVPVLVDTYSGTVKRINYDGVTDAYPFKDGTMYSFEKIGTAKFKDGEFQSIKLRKIHGDSADYNCVWFISFARAMSEKKIVYMPVTLVYGDFTFKFTAYEEGDKVEYIVESSYHNEDSLIVKNVFTKLEGVRSLIIDLNAVYEVWGEEYPDHMIEVIKDFK